MIRAVEIETATTQNKSWVVKGVALLPLFQLVSNGVRSEIQIPYPESGTPHSVYNDVGSVKTHFSAHLPGSVFSLARNLFSATKVRCSNRSMKPPRFHQPSIRSQPASGP
jgi:hypothetical protein